MKKNTATRHPATVVAETTPETAAVMQVVRADEPTGTADQDATPDLTTEQPASQAAPAEQPAAVVPAPLSLDDVMEKVNRIKSVSERLTQHRATGETLAAFQIGTSGFQDTLTLRDGAGKEWRTNRTPAIQMVLDLLRGELRNITTATEAELRELLAA